LLDIPSQASFTTLDHGSLRGPVNAGDNTTIFVIGTLTGTIPAAALSASGTGLLSFQGDVLVSAVQVSGGNIVTTGTLTLDAASGLGASASALAFTGSGLTDPGVTDPTAAHVSSRAG